MIFDTYERLKASGFQTSAELVRSCDGDPLYLVMSLDMLVRSGLAEVAEATDLGEGSVRRTMWRLLHVPTNLPFGQASVSCADLLVRVSTRGKP